MHRITPPRGNVEGDGTIDPRLLLAGSGEGVDDPLYYQAARSHEADDDIELEKSMNAFHEQARQRIAHGSVTEPNLYFPITHIAPQTPSSNGQPPLRPPLTIQTALASAGHSISTPKILVYTPTNDVVAPTAPSTSGWKGKARRHSSPARNVEPVQAETRRLLGVASRIASTGSTPMTPQTFVSAHSYNPGDRQAGVGSSSSGGMTQSYPPPGQMTTPSSSFSAPSVSARRQHFCTETDCPEAEQRKSFDTPNDLRKHQRKHIQHANRPYGCNLCGKRFLYPKDLTRHKRTHSADNRPTCPECGRKLSRDDNVVRHIQRVHRNIGTPTPSIAGRRASGTVASPATDSVASFSDYATSRPTTPLPYGNPMQTMTNNAYYFSGARAGATTWLPPEEMDEEAIDESGLPTTPTSPSLTVPMARSWSDAR